MPRSLDDWRRSEATSLPTWIKPQLTRLVDEAPDGPDWLHEIKFDGYRMHARLDRGAVRLLTRTWLDWTSKYPAIASAVASLSARQAYLDGELCGVRPDGSTSFSLIQNASDTLTAARSSSSCSISSTSMAKRSPRCRLRSGKNVCAPCCRMQARRCISAITRPGAVGRSTTMPAP
jgi:hypothetical protein